MTTKPPSKVHPLAPDALEAIAYASVEGIPTLEPHDRDRLGYCVYLWLSQRRDPLELAVRNAGARLLVSEQDALRKIREGLTARGIQL
ncbi:MAG: hypothetical protein C3F17_13460 [Bradyrhizobiaceae bacterium]|nr:MAG: hypothetical protein C3F17_13460 [Bradyrhizobiaceae bacterium]